MTAVSRTEPTRSRAPNCPPWCTSTHRAGDFDFELDHNDALLRWHSGRAGIIEESPQNVAADNHPGVVEWWLSVAEYLDGSHGPTHVSVETTGFPSLSLEQARLLARELLDAADAAERHLSGDARAGGLR